MEWNDHSKLEGLHAFLGASTFRWINWNDETLEKRYVSQYATQLGEAVHGIAKDCINSRIKLNETDRHLIEYSLYKAGIPKVAYDIDHIMSNLIQFVNDAIGFRMSPEIILYYSQYSFGTTDAIGINLKEKILRIHDLKNGLVPGHFEQLLIYAALFYLEYRMKPEQYKTILKIYQGGEILTYEPEYQEVEKFMELIKDRSNYVKNYIERSIY